MAEHTGTETLEILPQQHFGPRELMEQFNRFEQAKSLGKLTIVSGSFNSLSFRSILQCLDKNKLHYFNFTGTHLTQESMVELLTALSKQSELESLILENCMLQESSSEALTKLITSLQNLKVLNVNNHRFKNPQALTSALLKSTSIVKVTGLDVSPELRKHIEQNKRFETLDSFLRDWSNQQEKEIPTVLDLQLNKDTFYRKVRQIQEKPHNKSRLNFHLFQFYKYLAKNYHLNNDVQNAVEYYGRCLELNNNKHIQFQIHVELAQMLYVQGTEVVEKLNSLQEQAQELSRHEREDLRTQCELSLLQSYEHLKSADEATDNPTEKEIVCQFKQYCAKTTGEELIRHGEAILTEVSQDYSFSRDYARIPK